MEGDHMSLAEFVAGFLEPSERDAALGDIAESGGSTWEIAGLVVRRQWMVWAAFVPAAVLLTFLVLWRERSAVLGLFALRNYRDLDPATLAELGLTKPRILSHFVQGAWLPALVALVTGFILARLAGRAIWLNATLFVLASVGALLYRPPAFRTVLVPIVLQIILIWIPLLIGTRMRRRTT
jgi:H+/gluconate symporter-like permease